MRFDFINQVGLVIFLFNLLLLYAIVIYTFLFKILLFGDFITQLHQWNIRLCVLRDQSAKCVYLPCIIGLLIYGIVLAIILIKSLSTMHNYCISTCMQKGLFLTFFHAPFPSNFTPILQRPFDSKIALTCTQCLSDTLQDMSKLYNKNYFFGLDSRYKCIFAWNCCVKFVGKQSNYVSRVVIKHHSFMYFVVRNIFFMHVFLH